MKLKLTFSIALVFFLLPGCDLADSNDGRGEITLTQKAAKQIEAENDFGFELFQNIYASETEYENIMVSPLSVSLALAMTFNGANGETKTAMEKTLKLYGLTTGEINSSYQTLLAALKSLDEKVILEIADAVFYRQNFSVENDFITVNRKFYDAEVSPLDFTSPGAVDVKNDWVADTTNDKIESIIDKINEDNVMFLLNAIYFKGIWESEFEKSDTKEKDFYLEDGSTVKTDFMQQNNSVLYASNDLFSAVQLPYGQGNYNMYVFLPETDKTLQDITDNLNKDNWDPWMESFTETNVDIEFPKFKYEYEIKLNDVLSEMGTVKNPEA